MFVEVQTCICNAKGFFKSTNFGGDGTVEPASITQIFPKQLVPCNFCASQFAVRKRIESPPVRSDFRSHDSNRKGHKTVRIAVKAYNFSLSRKVSSRAI